MDMEPVHLAIRHRDLQELRNALNAGADVNARDRVGETALHLAARDGFAEAVALLIARGANVNVENDHGCSALRYAYNGYNGLCAKLLREAGADVRWLADPESASLLFAAMEGDGARVGAQVSAGVSVDVRASDGTTPLICAAGGCHLEVVRLLLELGADLSLEADVIESDQPGGRGDTALAVAASRGSREVVSLLLDHGADPNETYVDEWTPMTHAVFNCDHELARLLLDRGASVFGASEGRPSRGCPLAIASWMGCLECVRLLLDRGAGSRPLDLQDAYRATFIDNGANVRPLLLDAGVRIGLVEAIVQEDPRLVRKMIEEGADVNKVDAWGLTPLMHAAGHWEPSGEIVSLLLDLGADVHALSGSGKTALSMVQKGARATEVVRLLSTAAKTGRGGPPMIN